MCDIDCPNLIDLSLDEKSPNKTEHFLQQPSESQGLLQFVSPPYKKRDSLDNNPFDCAQKLANCQDDPFDIVERQACLKAKLSCTKPVVEVKLGNLLSLSDDNLLDDDGNYGELGEENRCKSKMKDIDLESESPPVTLLHKFQGDSNSGTDTDSTPSSSAELTSANKTKKAMEYRKRLLKLSITNAAFSSPMSRRGSLEEVDSMMGTPKSSSISKSTSPYSEYSLASESPLKFVEDDIDIMSEEPPALLDAEKNFEADLEMLKIPILSELPSPVIDNVSDSVVGTHSGADNEQVAIKTKSKILDLEAIKAKLKAKREEKNNTNNQEIKALIGDLKCLIDSGDITNDKQMQAATLLESLSSVLSSSQNKVSALAPPQPQPIKRQGTFDLELREESAEQNFENQPLVTEMPNCMVSSSATYDGETADEKEDLQLPEIEPASPQSPNAETTLQPDVNDIVEQLSKLLVNNSSADGSQNNQQNPTFIVVMNTTPMPQKNNSISVIAPAARQKAAMIASYMEHSSIEDSASEVNVAKAAATRRRSQSLSLHDKVKIVQLPIQPPTPKILQKQNSMVVMEDETSPSTPPPTELEDHDFKTPELRTPARMVRRNSYSSGTPYTTTVGLRRPSISGDNKSFGHLRMTQTLDTHHEGGQQPQQQKAIVRPMSMLSNHMSSFKPDLKKKHKANTESIMKSSGPLKATIPMKRVAPMLKTSPPTPDNGCSDDLHNSSAQQKNKKMPTTPMASGRSSSLGIPAGYPNACSTPSAFTSPMKRSTAAGAVPKPRYSYLSTTPNAKPTVAPLNPNLKRRTISEFKAKSPLKPRSSYSASSAAASTSLRSAGVTTRSSTSSRLSTSSMAKLPTKTTSKLGPNTAAVKPIGRTNSRYSSTALAPSSRNKENKQP
ncbi:uncharacterized protein LOC106086919 [Stomoxys calcitrans]|uniref:uncharacterized protein LOC106086919 n=1 Tax=Stomoxys calcitrans TaxID=35570 RepID=UPI0027E26F92|nr:uncharacterized protein LOC106086919 [Stomoxys calcitrans]